MRPVLLRAEMKAEGEMRQIGYWQHKLTVKARTASVQTGDHTAAEQGPHDPQMGMVGLGVTMVVNMVEFKITVEINP